MRVAVVGFNNLKYSPYINTYTDILDEHAIEYDVIIPNRNQFDEVVNGRLLPIEWDQSKNKLQNFNVFARKTRKILESQDYDFVFVLTTLPAILLSRTLVQKYPKKYLVDIRDYTYDKKLFFKTVEAYVLKNAHTRVISSPAFKKFLPDLEYVLCHNFAHKTTNADIAFKKGTIPIKIGYVGTIAYVDECRRLIDLVKSDERFSFYLYGNEVNGSIISDYVINLHSERIRYFGGYEPGEKKQIISNIDILFNDYGNGSDLVRYALSNKLYDSFLFKKPLITSPNTMMSDLGSDYSFDIDSDTKNLEALYEWYSNINEEAIISYMNQCLEAFRNENLMFENKIREIIGAQT